MRATDFIDDIGAGILLVRLLTDYVQMDKLFRRRVANGATLGNITTAEARRIEPLIETWKRVFFSPKTKTVSPGRIHSFPVARSIVDQFDGT